MEGGGRVKGKIRGERWVDDRVKGAGGVGVGRGVKKLSMIRAARYLGVQSLNNFHTWWSAVGVQKTQYALTGHDNEIDIVVIFLVICFGNCVIYVHSISI